MPKINGDSIVSYKVYNTCTVYKYADNDSTNKSIDRVLYYDLKGNVIETEFFGYGYARSNTINFYNKNNQLITTFHINKNKYGLLPAIEKITYTYTDNKLTSEKLYHFVRHLKEGINKGYEYGDCIIRPEDIEPERKWDFIKTINYTYANGRIYREVCEKDELDDKEVVTYTYLNDKINKIERWSKFDGLYRVENYYYNKKNTISIDNVDYKYGIKNNAKEIGYGSILTYNDDNKLIERIAYDKATKKYFNHQQFFYNNAGKLEREIFLDDKIFTTLYIYENKGVTTRSFSISRF